MKKLITLVLAICLFGIAATVSAEDKAKAMAVVDAVAAYYEANGKEATIAELSKPIADSAFNEFEPLYAFAYDLNYNMVAHYKTKLIGKNFEKLPDVKGNFFRKDIVDTAKAKGTGWVDYWYKNPATGKLEPKTTYVKLVGDIVIACGIYK